jgi:hypothetical protein
MLSLKPPKVDELEPLRGLKFALRTLCIPVAVLTFPRETRAVVQRHRLRVDSAIMKAVDWAPCSMVMHRLGCSWRWLNPPSKRKPALCASTGSMVGWSPSAGIPALADHFLPDITIPFGMRCQKRC